MLRPARYFVMGGGATPSEVVDRASAHGEPIAAAAHRAPGPGWYGAVEIRKVTQQSGAGAVTAGSNEGAGACTREEGSSSDPGPDALAPGELGGAP